MFPQSLTSIFAEGFDIKLLEWKEKVEQGVEKEKEILANLSKAHSSDEEVICSYTEDLRKHRGKYASVIFVCGG